jgi:hypothetical protein
VIVAVVVIVVAYRVTLARRGRVRSLPHESKARYADSWNAIQARFVTQPEVALGEADQLALSILLERGAKIKDGWRPAEMLRARELARTNGGASATEGPRKAAMSQYEAIIDEAVGDSMHTSPNAMG